MLSEVSFLAPDFGTQNGRATGNSKGSKSKCYFSPKMRFLANAEVSKTLVKSIASAAVELPELPFRQRVGATNNSSGNL